VPVVPSQHLRRAAHAITNGYRAPTWHAECDDACPVVSSRVIPPVGGMVLLALAACVPPPQQPYREPILPEGLPGPTYNSRVVALRTTLGRAAIRLEMRGEVEEVKTPGCYSRSEFSGCAVCELVGEDDPLDGAVLESLVTAFDRYPSDVLEATHVDKVALCKDIVYRDPAGKKVAGTIDVEERRLLISLKAFFNHDYEWASQWYTTEHIVHHELFHLFEHERMRTEFDDDPEWRLMNPPGFVYTNAAQETRPAGFVNEYATTNEVEDRASVFEMIMSTPDELCAIAKDDEVVRTKVELVWRRAAALVGDSFMRVRAPCVDWIEDRPEAPQMTGISGSRWLHRAAGEIQPRWLRPPSR
jgi:hypothetical protein